MISLSVSYTHLDVYKRQVEDFPILMANSGTTLAEGFLGLGLGIALAFVTAVLMDRYRFLYKSLYPILVITQTIPTVAIAPLLVLWMGYDMAPKIALVVIVCFFPMAVGLLDGFRSADQDTVNLLRSMGASKGQIFRLVKLPSSLGRFFSSPVSYTHLDVYKRQSYICMRGMEQIQCEWLHKLFLSNNPSVS